MNVNDEIVVRMRFVVHTMGLAGWDKSRNHWSIYLILRGDAASVRFNMSLANGSDENGTFTVTPHSYTESNSSLQWFDYNTCAGLTVGHCLYLIRNRGRDRYRMTGSGNGCRYWVWRIFLDFATQRYILVSNNQQMDFGQLIQMRYHRNSRGQIVQIQDPMEVGEFV